MALTQTIVHEVGDLVYLIAPVSPIEPSSEQIEEYAFGRSIVDAAAHQAPNPFIKWYGGHYVEADNPNGNGAMWTAKEIALKQLTPRFMPVTVMHNPTAAVGLIADVALRTPERDSVPRPKLETALAIWAHRFPDVVEEAELNYRSGSLMQSMECLAPAYSCGDCGMGFLKLPGKAEQANWCEHLKSATAVRILAATTFTGTGLIFGTRGASGADPLAHLEDFKAEVAEFHQKGARDRHSPTRSKPTMDITIDKAEYDALQARPTREQLETAEAERDRATRAQEVSEADNVALKASVTAKDAEIVAFQEQANRDTLRETRLAKLGDKFTGALGDLTRERLKGQAGTMQDVEWNDRLAELAELVKVQPDEKVDPATTPPPTGGGAPAPSGTPTFTAEEVARQQIKGVGGDGITAPPAVGRNVIAGLLTRPKSTPAAK